MEFEGLIGYVFCLEDLGFISTQNLFYHRHCDENNDLNINRDFFVNKKKFSM